MTYYFLSTLFAIWVLFSCNAQDTVKNKSEPFFANRIEIKDTIISISNSDSIFLKKAAIRKFLYYCTENDSGFIYKTGDFTYYLLRNSTFTRHEKRYQFLPLNPLVDIFKYGDSLYTYNTKTNVVKPLFGGETTDSSYVFRLPSSSPYMPRTPYSAQLIKLNGQFGFLYNYSLTKKTNPNYADSTPFLITIDSTRQYKLGRYPPVFYKQFMQFNVAAYTIDSSSNIYYVYQGFDSVYKINSKGQELARGLLHEYPKRDVYKTGDEDNIAYIRKYEHTNEKNYHIALWRNRYVLVIKQLAANTVLEKQRYKLFVFNTNLEKLYAAEMPNDIVASITLNNKGFIVFDKNLRKVYCYELP